MRREIVLVTIVIIYIVPLALALQDAWKGGVSKYHEPGGTGNWCRKKGGRQKRQTDISLQYKTSGQASDGD